MSDERTRNVIAAIQSKLEKQNQIKMAKEADDVKRLEHDDAKKREWDSARITINTAVDLVNADILSSGLEINKHHKRSVSTNIRHKIEILAPLLTRTPLIITLDREWKVSISCALIPLFKEWKVRSISDVTIDSMKDVILTYIDASAAEPVLQR